MTRLVLDTNIAFYEPLDQLYRLRDRGFVISLSAVALYEALAKSVREFDGGLDRARARGKFFGRAQKLKAVLDPTLLVAPVAGQAMRRVRTSTGELFEPTANDGDQDGLWRTVSGIGWTDEEWCEHGHEAEAWLQAQDDALKEIAQSEDRLRERTAAVWSEELEAAQQAFDSYSVEEKLRHIQARIIEAWCLRPEAAERLDCHVKMAAFRFNQAAHRAQMPGKNDGCDSLLGVHIAEQAIVLTDERRLVRTVDACGTFQRAWFRRMADLDQPFCDGPPWGDEARAFNAQWVRAS